MKDPVVPPPASPRPVDAWLAEGDAPTADWASYLLRRALKGELGHAGAGLLLDLVPLTQPYACRSGACTPGRRERGIRSCCADLDVSVTAEEADTVRRALPEVAQRMGDDPRWSAGPPDVLDGDTLTRPGGRCVFARDAPEGLRCALHEQDPALKPLPCRLFPLALVDLGDGRRLLTAIHRRTSRHLDAPPTRALPCLGAGPPLYISEQQTIEAVFGEAVWRRLHACAPPPPG